MARPVLFLAVLLLGSSSLATAQSIDSIVRGEATAKSGSISQLKTSVATAVTEAVASSCTGDITAVGQALAVAVANASATAWAKAKAKVEVVGTGKGCAAAKSTATAVATAVAEATASSMATASNGCEDGAMAEGTATSTKSAIATAIAEASAAACSTGGVAEATTKAVAKAVLSVTASAYVQMIAKIRGKCDLCPEDEPADNPETKELAEPSPPTSDKPADSPAPIELAGEPSTPPADSGLATAQIMDSIVKAEATAKSGSISQLKTSVATAVTEAVASSCTGDITAVGQALAVAVANASATAWAKAKAKVEVVGTGKGCAAAKSTATAVATAVAEATASSMATASNGCEDGAMAEGTANSTKSAIATAIAEASAAACSTGGVAEATAKAVARAVVSVTASAYVEMIARIRGKCDLCPEDEPADSPAPIGGDPGTWGPPLTAEASPQPADKPAEPSPKPNEPSTKPDDTATPPTADIAGTVPSPSPAAKDKGKDMENLQDKKASPAPASPAPVQKRPIGPLRPVVSKHTQCDKSLKSNGCCGGKGFVANASVCQCMVVNGRKYLNTCRYTRVIDSTSTDILWKDKFGGLKPPCKC